MKRSTFLVSKSGLCLKGSNVKCVFVTTGFPTNRSCFYRKVFEDKEDEILEHSDDEDQVDNDTFTDQVEIWIVVLLQLLQTRLL